MIDGIGFEPDFSIVSNVTNAKPGEIYFGFEELLTEKIVSQQTEIHGFVGDGQDLCPGLNEMTIEVIKALMSLSDGLENIWEIVLRLEKRVDIEGLSENFVTDFDDAAGWFSVAALLTQFWKKKELLEVDVPENSVDISTCLNQNYIENRTASELDALILKTRSESLLHRFKSLFCQCG